MPFLRGRKLLPSLLVLRFRVSIWVFFILSLIVKLVIPNLCCSFLFSEMVFCDRYLLQMNQWLNFCATGFDMQCLWFFSS